MSIQVVFNKERHKQEIENLVNAALPQYLEILEKNGVSPEDINKMKMSVLATSLCGLRKAEDFVAFVGRLQEVSSNSISEDSTGVFAQALQVHLNQLYEDTPFIFENVKPRWDRSQGL